MTHKTYKDYEVQIAGSHTVIQYGTEYEVQHVGDLVTRIMIRYGEVTLILDVPNHILAEPRYMLWVTDDPRKPPGKFLNSVAATPETVMQQFSMLISQHLLTEELVNIVHYPFNHGGNIRFCVQRTDGFTYYMTQEIKE